MGRSVYCIRVDQEVWDLFQNRFPRQASPMIEEYMRDVVSSDIQEGESREELTSKLNEIKEARAKAEREERILQQQLNAYDQEIEKRKEILESEEADSKKERYKELSPALRQACGEVCYELQSLKLEGFDSVIYPFDFYHKLLDEDFKVMLYNTCDRNDAIHLKSLLFKFYRILNKENNKEDAL